MTIQILRPGLLTTLQDLGRKGHQRHGIVVSGAMDTFALRTANLLIGNCEDEAALEITLVGPVIEFQTETLIALCGADLSAACQGQSLPMWRPVWIRGGSRLEFGKVRSGARAYLAVAGGFEIEPVLGSKSTFVRGQLGGYQGRALQKGDVLAIGSLSAQAGRLRETLSGQPDSPFWATNWAVGRGLMPNDPKQGSQSVIRVITGAQLDAFTKESRERFFSTAYQVTPQSDRMGYRLQGVPLTLTEPLEMISAAVTFGTIQVPPEGQPIVLMADRQTTGGYPKIAEVIAVDLPVLAQLKPGESVCFAPVKVEEAQELYRVREREIGLLKQGILLKR